MKRRSHGPPAPPEIRGLVVPRFVTEKKAADELGLDLSRFRHLATTGRIPQPDPEIGLYDIKAIHAAFDRSAGIGGTANELDAWVERAGAR